MLLHRGVVVWVGNKGFGYIKPDSGTDNVWFHWNNGKALRFGIKGLEWYGSHRSDYHPVRLPKVNDRVVFSYYMIGQRKKAMPWGYEFQLDAALEQVECRVLESAYLYDTLPNDPYVVYEGSNLQCASSFFTLNGFVKVTTDPYTRKWVTGNGDIEVVRSYEVFWNGMWTRAPIPTIEVAMQRRPK